MAHELHIRDGNVGNRQRIRLAVAAVVVLCFIGSAVMAQETRPASVEPESKAEGNPPRATYSVVRIAGAIGRDFTAKAMERAIEAAREGKATVLVLDIDTPGGSVTAAEEIIDAIITAKDVRFVAFVRKALSAGAAITLACREVYVADTATIGAAVSYVPDQSGMPAHLPADVAEKMQSAWRAVCRKAAQRGGHDSLLAEAMADPEFALTMRKEGERVIIERDGKGDVLKAKGRILTLTAQEAVSCGLAKGVVGDWAALGRDLALPDWQEVSLVTDTPELVRNLAEKATALGLTGAAMTDLQAEKAWSEWDQWVQREIANRQVRWTVTLLAAGEARRIVPWNEDLPASRVITTKDYEWAIEAARFRAEVAWYGAEDRATFIARARDPSPCPEGHSLIVFAQFPGNPEVFVIATVADSAKDFLAGVARGDSFVLSGTTAGATVWWPSAPHEGIWLPRRRGAPLPGAERERVITINLDRCKAGKVGPESETAPSSPTQTPESIESGARAKLALAQTYIASGLTEKAADILKGIIQDFPDTKAATEARKLLTPTTQPRQ